MTIADSLLFMTLSIRRRSLAQTPLVQSKLCMLPYQQHTASVMQSLNFSVKKNATIMLSDAYMATYIYAMKQNHSFER